MPTFRSGLFLICVRVTGNYALYCKGIINCLLESPFVLTGIVPDGARALSRQYLEAVRVIAGTNKG